MKKILLGFLIILCVMAGWYWYKDPLSSLDRGKPTLRLLEKNTYKVPDGNRTREYHDYVFETGAYGVLHFTLSLPERIPSEGLPCVVIVDGLETGKRSLELVDNHGDYALIAFEYPEALHLLKNYKVLFHLLEVRKGALQVPGQILSIVDWVEKMPWYNGEPVPIMGFSFGSEFVPAIYHLAKDWKVTLGPAVLAYGGAGLFRLFYAIPGNSGMKVLRGALGAILFRAIEPERHLPYISGEFLVINGVYDKLIPFQAAQKLQKLVPEPKTIINLETAHLQPKNDTLLKTLVKMARDWLEEKRKEDKEKRKAE